MIKSISIPFIVLALTLGTADAVLVYNANFGSNSVTQWNTQGPFSSSTFLSGVSGPVGVGVDPLGKVYVTQFGEGGKISKYNADGTFVSSINNLGYLPYSIRFDSAGTLYVADLNNSLIRRYTDTLSPLSNWATTSGSPTSIQFTPEGFVLVANSGAGDNAQKFSLAGNSLQIIGGFPTLDEPHDAVTDPSGNILVASRNNLRIVKYDSAGNLINDNFISGFDPYSMLVSESTLFVAAHNLGTIRRYNVLTGDYLGDFAVGALPTYMAVNPIDIGPATVPEPGQVAASILLLAGIGGYFFAKRRNIAEKMGKQMGKRVAVTDS